MTRLRPELARQGVLYPDLTPRSAAEPHLNHQHLGETLDGRRPRHERTELLDGLSRQLGGSAADVAIISYEHLCLVPPRLGVAALLAELFARHGFAMEILATIKPQAELLNSTYTWRSQFLRERRRFDTYAAAELGHSRFDYARLFEPWRRASSGRMTVVPMRDPRSGRPVLARFLDAAGVSDRAAPFVTQDDLALRENRSPGPIAVETFRRLRRSGAHLRLGRDARQATRFVEESCAARGLDDVSFRGVDPLLRARMETRWQAANARLASAAWGESWSARVAGEPVSAVNEIARSGNPADGLAEVDALLQAVCQRFRLNSDAVVWHGLSGSVARLVRGGRGLLARAGRH